MPPPISSLNDDNDCASLLPMSTETSITMDTPEPASSGDQPGTSSAEGPVLRIIIDRPVYDQEDFDEKFGQVDTTCDTLSLDKPEKPSQALFKKFLPPLTWLPEYKKAYLVRDVIVGLTICVLSIPQAMAYAALANVPAVLGLYTSLFSTLIYAVFGTSKHIMFGMFAVPSLMVGSLVEEYSMHSENLTLIEKNNEAVAICVTITFCLGIIFSLMAICQMHVLTAYLSNNLVTGFTTAASIHVLASQIPKLAAIRVNRYSGFLKLFLIARDMVVNAPEYNPAELIISAVCVAFLMVGRYLINPRVLPLVGAPIPFELFVVIATTVISYVFGFNEKYNVHIVATIPTGVPTPMLPHFTMVPELFLRCLPIAIVIFGVTLSVGKLFAKKHAYKVNPAQDLRAIALVHLTTSFLRCVPSSGSLTRSAVASQLGSKSQIASIFNSFVVLIVILWLGPLFYTLPTCVLASIIVVALQGMLLQLRELPRLWLICKIDFSIWVVAFLATFLSDVSEGLLVAVGFALFTVVLRVQMPRSTSMGMIPETELYRDVDKYQSAHSLEDILILRYNAPLLFVNAHRFIHTACGVITDHYDDRPVTSKNNNNKDNKAASVPLSSEVLTRFLVIDATGISQIDQMGVEALRELHFEVKRFATQLLIAGPKAPVRDLFAACNFFSTVPKSSFFPSVHDAVVFAQNLQQKSKEKTTPVSKG